MRARGAVGARRRCTPSRSTGSPGTRTSIRPTWSPSSSSPSRTACGSPPTSSGASPTTCTSACRCGSCSSSTTACGSRSSSPTRTRRHRRSRASTGPRPLAATDRHRLSEARSSRASASPRSAGASTAIRSTSRSTPRLAAIADAGLTRDDIDGLATYPGNMKMPPGFSGVGITEVQDALRLEPQLVRRRLELPGQLGSVVNAIAAVATGLANHVLCFRTVWEASAQGDQGRASVTTGGGGGGFQATGFMQWTLPFGAPSAVELDRDDGPAPLPRVRHDPRAAGPDRRSTPARNAALNPNAIYRDPMTLDDYLSVRMVSTPLCLYDCDVPADGSTAVIVSRADAAPDLRKPPVQRRGGGHRAARPSVVGPVRRPHHDGAARRGGDDVGAHRPHARPTSTWPSCTTGSASSRCAGSRRSASAATARADRSSRAAPTSPATA